MVKIGTIIELFKDGKSQGFGYVNEHSDNKTFRVIPLTKKLKIDKRKDFRWAIDWTSSKFSWNIVKENVELDEIVNGEGRKIQLQNRKFDEVI